MPINRELISPNVPTLPAVVEYLFDRYGAGDVADLAQVVVVLPGLRAGRRLLEVLVAAADDRQLALVPPEIRTVGTLPELLYRPARPFADELVQQLAWAKTLAAVDRRQLTQVVRDPPAEQDIGGWCELGDLLRRTHLELAADGLDFSHVVAETKRAGEQDERRRWQVLHDVQKNYLKLLDRLELWDRQTARLVAIEKRECGTDRQLLLVGTVDINRTLRQMLDQVADQVTVLIPAAPEWADRFDEHGCLLPAAWAEVEIDIPDDRIFLADDPADQADAVVRCLARYNGRYRPDEITIGLPDERTVPQIERLLEQCELPARWGPGRSIADTAPFRLLEAVGRYAEDGRFEDLAALVRHPDVTAWIDRAGMQTDWLSQLDEYFGNHLPTRLGKKWLGSESDYRQIQQVEHLVGQLVGPLAGRERPLGQWSAPLVAVLRMIYGDHEFDRRDPAQRAVLTACDALHKVLVAHESGPAQSLLPPVSAARALSIALNRARSAAVPAPADRAAIELLGWLELPLDDAPAVIVTSLNEGLVPTYVNSDLLLPDALRRRLGLEDNARRYARDAYALSVILTGRPDVDLIVARRNADNDPLAPSRLLFAADRDTIARRALRLFSDPPPPAPKQPLAGGLMTRRDVSDFPYLPPEPLDQPITSLSPTGFRDYLACPYRFYLGHVLRLTALTDDARELDATAFGNLLHDVLRRFGESELRDATDAEEIRRCLSQLLDRRAGQVFGDSPLAAVRVQVEQARMRLAAFADRQARWAEQWRIEHTELYVADHQARLEVDGQPFYLRGRLDRVDVNRETGERVVLDYKSSDVSATPEKAHRRSGDWVDLQLPLYRHLAAGAGIEGPVQLGYVQLPRDVDKVEFCLAEWSEADLRSADQTAAEVVRNLRCEVFWPPADPPPAYSQQYAWLCHDNVFDKPPYATIRQTATGGPR